LIFVDLIFFSTGKSKKKVNDSNLVVKKETQNEENLVTSSSEVYKMPLVWIDLEMTGTFVPVRV
jgi:hypothetical protein